MTPPVLHHAHLLCRDLEPMLAFWTGALGATLVRRRKFGADDGAELDLGAHPAMLFLRQIAPDAHERTLPCFGYDHLGMTVTDMDAALEEILKHPLASLHTPPASGTLKFAFIKGPENVLVELVEKPAA